VPQNETRQNWSTVVTVRSELNACLQKRTKHITSPHATKARLSTQENSSNLGSGVMGKTDRQIYVNSNQCISGKI
jgi:hypothetical protein